MPRDRQASGACPNCQTAPVTCTYNLFLGETERIDSWEHRCANCGHRETRAVRSGDDEADTSGDPTICPYCGRKGNPGE